MSDTYAHAERVAICVESGIPADRAEAIAACEQSKGPCTCGTGHRVKVTPGVRR